MILSMTAFARSQRQGEWGTLVCELRSINHRFLEISLHLPEVLRVLEMPIRDRIRQLIKRGKVECTLRYQPRNESQGALVAVNPVLAQEYCLASEKVSGLLQNPAPINPVELLRFPGVLETRETNLADIEAELFPLLSETVNELIAARGREGEGLKQLFFQRIDAMRKELVAVRQRLPQVISDQSARLLKRFQDAKVELDANRLEQEMVFFAQRLDVSEEIERTETHLTEMTRVLKEGGIVGRRLDFLLQELNREANTLGSKSTDTVLTHAAVEMKVLIEQVREQVQNIE